MLVDDRDRRVTAERRPPGEQLIQQAAGRVQVAAGIHPLAAGLLRRQILRGADHLGGPGYRDLAAAQRTGDAEVRYLDITRAGQHHVRRLDVAVHDAVAVAVVQRAQDAVDDLKRALRQQPPAVAEQIVQRPAVDVLHHDVGHGSGAGHVLAGVVDRDDRRVVERGRGLRLPAETRLEGLVTGQVVTERLHSHDTAQEVVTRPVYLGHAATPGHAVELIAAAKEPRLSHISHYSLPF